MNSALRKGWIAAGVIAAAGATFAAFTTPPFNTTPAYTSPMVWQCYSALVERTGAVCTNTPTHPSAVIPSRTHWYLVYFKSTVQAMITAGNWTHSTLANYHTNRLTTNNVLTIAGLGADFWTNTPPAGQATATNGWHGLRRIITNMVWTVERGYPSTCNGSNVFASKSGGYCNMATMESNFGFAVSAYGFPLFEGRDWNVSTNVTYQGYTVREHWLVDAPFIFQPCPDAYPPPSPWIYFSFTDETNQWTSCSPPPANSWNCAGDTNLTLEAAYDYYVITNTITDPCSNSYVCALAVSDICSHVAPISFPNCPTAPTNQTFAAEEWYNSGATGTCAGASATWNNPFGVSLSSAGWASVFTYNATNDTTLCRTNFATARVPWTNQAVDYAWAIYDAVIVKKWNFDY